MTGESHPRRIVALCDECGATAQTLEYRDSLDAPKANGTRPKRGGMVVATGIKGRRVFFLHPSEGLVQAFARGDRALEMGLCLDVDIGADYCQECRVSYCSHHWRKMPKFVHGRLDYAEAECPRGHAKCFSVDV